MANISILSLNNWKYNFCVKLTIGFLLCLFFWWPCVLLIKRWLKTSVLFCRTSILSRPRRIHIIYYVGKKNKKNNIPSEQLNIKLRKTAKNRQIESPKNSFTRSYVTRNFNKSKRGLRICIVPNPRLSCKERRVLILSCMHNILYVFFVDATKY
jgi:hypothetical protein